jgi:hypothetical protein
MNVHIESLWDQNYNNYYGYARRCCRKLYFYVLLYRSTHETEAIHYSFIKSTLLNVIATAFLCKRATTFF